MRACVPEAVIAAPRKKSWLRRLLKAMAWTLGLFLLLCVLPVLVFRFVPVPGSALMAERRINSWFKEGPYQARHAWVCSSIGWQGSLPP